MHKLSNNQLPDNELLAVFDNAAIVLILVDQDGRVARINKAGSELVDAGNEKIMGLLAGQALRCVNLHKNENAVCGCTEECARCDLRNLFSQVFDSGKDILKSEGAITIIRNGEAVKLQLLISASRLIIEREPYVLLTIDDVSLLKEQEEILKRLVKTRDKLYSVIAHDLRSPLSVIIGFADFLVTNFETVEKKQIQSFLEHIQHSSHDAHNLLNNLFEWTSNQWNNSSVVPRWVNVSELCKEVLGFCNPMAKGKELHIRYLDGFSDDWRFDEDMVKTILRNLVINAIKFTNRGGKVEIETKQQGNSLWFSVTDTGVGIQEQVLRSMFNGNGGDSSIGTESEKGTGLGLMICKEFVEKHGGEIKVESEVGKGTCFYFNIPSDISNQP